MIQQRCTDHLYAISMHTLDHSTGDMKMNRTQAVTSGAQSELGLEIFHQLKKSEGNKEETSGRINHISHGSKSVT